MGTTYRGRSNLKLADAIAYLNAGGFTGIDAILYVPGKGIRMIYLRPSASFCLAYLYSRARACYER